MAAGSLRQVEGFNSRGLIGVKNFSGHVRTVHHHRCPVRAGITTSAAQLFGGQFCGDRLVWLGESNT